MLGEKFLVYSLRKSLNEDRVIEQTAAIVAVTVIHTTYIGHSAESKRSRKLCTNVLQNFTNF